MDRDELLYVATHLMAARIAYSIHAEQATEQMVALAEELINSVNARIPSNAPGKPASKTEPTHASNRFLDL